MDKVYQVFVSSTFSDLQEERQNVSQTLAKAGYMASGMELFPATDMQQLEFIKRIIDRSDYYVVIVAGKYGSLADDGRSFTENEYEYAVSKRIPVLAFLHEDPSKIAVGKTDQDRGKAKKLDGFRDKLKASRIVDFWSDERELCTKVVIAVGNQVNLAPGVGWVRGDNAVDPKLLQDCERLRRENEELKQQLAELNASEVTFPSDLPSPDNPVDVTYKKRRAGGRALLREEETCRISTTWKKLFIAGSEEILSERPEMGIAIHAIAVLTQDTMIFHVDVTDLAKLRFQFEALGLIRTAHKQLGKDGAWLTWSITEKGRRYLLQQKAIRIAKA
jgi:Domain of unknown function (DUF4062)